MCATCGCDGMTHEHEHEHEHEHDHDHEHHHHHHEHHRPGTSPGPTRVVTLEAQVLEKNDALAAENRVWLQRREIRAFNLMSSPGAGKTTLLERTLRDCGAGAMAVIEGDQDTARDAERIRAAGARAVQINTGAGCHLDASMVARAIDKLSPEPRSILFIENVGNLVCPALFDLGERARVVIASVTEGDDKPIKYPHMFRAADLVVLNKVDLLPHVEFDVDRFSNFARHINPRVRILPLSATRGQGLDAWYGWLTA
jgi:hydrogenase nickel incorporation protein HypB